MWGLALRFVGLAAVAYLASCGEGEGEKEGTADAGPRTGPTPDAGNNLPANRPPQWGSLSDKFTRENEILNFSLLASDPDGDHLIYSGINLPEGASLSSSGLFSWRPNFQQAGDYSFPVTVSDGQHEVTSSVNIHVQNVNQPPVFNPIANQSIQEGQLLSFQVSASDPDGTPVRLSSASLSAGALFNSSTGQFSWTPSINQAGNYMVTFNATDGEATVSQTVNISVGDVNQQPPELSPIGNRVVNEGQALNFRVTATDPDQNPITYQVTGLPAGATFDVPTGQFSWTPGYRSAGAYPVTFAASDGIHQDSETIMITVNNVLHDLDGDGFREDEDCNDDDASVYPLREFAVNHIATSMTVCPGVYRGINVLIEGDNVSFNGSGVTLDGARAAVGDRAVLAADRDSITVSGFTIRNYPIGIYLDNVQNSTVEVGSVVGSQIGIQMDNSHGNQITADEIAPVIRLDSSSANQFQVTNAGDMTLENGSNGNAIENMLLSGRITLHASNGNTLSGVSFSGTNSWRIGIADGSNDNVIRNSTIRGGRGLGTLGVGALSFGISSGSGGSRNTVEDNTFEGNECAVNILGGVGNAFRRNIIRFNGSVAAFNIAGSLVSGTVVENNQITDNRDVGLMISTRGNTITNNDLRRNGGGNAMIHQS